MKSCRVCNIEKPRTDFVRNKAFSSGFDTICLICSREKVKQWRKNNPEKRKLQLKRESGKDYNHNKHLKATYGISRDVYLEMFNKQNGCCAICNKHQINFKRRLHVDHNHITGKIRALLCNLCNSMIGTSQEDPEILTNAIKYLEKYNG